MPTPPPGFVLDTTAPRRSAPPPPPEGFVLDATGEVHDGDTFALSNRTNGRLLGADAFELNQTGMQNGQPVRLGQLARDNLARNINPQTRVRATGAQSYGRPIVTANTAGQDVGRVQIGSGLALPVPKYLNADPVRLKDYVATQRDAIASERGAYSGTYQTPADFRHQGTAAPVVGKIPMTPRQHAEYSVLLRSPHTTPDQLDTWFKAQGQMNVANVPNLLAFIRRNPQAIIGDYFQQHDVMGAPVLKEGQNVATRHLGALNEGIIDTVGAPVDLVNSALGFAGLPASDRPFLGSNWLRDKVHPLNIGQPNDSYAPRSGVERYTQAFSRGVGQAAIPVGGTLAAGSRLALRAPSALTQASVFRTAARNALTDSAAAPAMTVAAEVGGGAGANIGGQTADDLTPGNPWAQLAGNTLGALVGGVGAVGALGRLRTPVRPVSAHNTGVSHSPMEAPRARPESSGGQIEPIPAPPEGFIVEGPLSAHVDAEFHAPSLSAPVRQPDRIDVGYRPPPPGFVLDPPLGRPAPMSERPAPEHLANAARRVNPEDVQPIPNNAVESVDEMAALSEGVRPKVEAPDERSFLPMQPRGGKNRRDPLDLIGWLRTRGGVQDHAGELSSMDLTNKSRNMDFARGEGFLGAVVNPRGMTLDDAAEAAWEAGYFAERPSIPEFLDALDATNRGGQDRVFHPDDLGAIDEYYKALDQRAQVEHAAQEGSPLAYDRGQPITQADLEANQPPVTAYEDLPKVGGKVANINLANVNSRHDIRRLLQNTETAVGGFDAARRGKISHGETEALASELGMTPDALLKRRQGQAMNAEEALAARQLLAKSGDELITLAGKVTAAKADGGASGAELAEFQSAWLRHAAIQEQVTGATSEAGRTLQQFRIAANSNAIRGRVHASMIEGGGGRDRLEDAAAAILDLQKTGADPGQVNKFALEALKPKWSDKLVELWYNSLLSGPQTHAVNVLSNTTTALLQIPEHIAAATLGQLRRGSVDRVMASELAPRIVGQLQGTKDGFRAFAKTLKTGEVPDFVTKVESRSQKAISGIKGEIIRTPSRFLAAEDELFKAIARRSEIAGLAMRTARGEGLKGDALYSRVKDLTNNPTDAMIDSSLDYARYVTYQRPLGTLGQGISQITQKHPIFKLFIPFVRTPSNIIKFVAERSPVAPILKEWRADILAGGARRDLAAAKMVLGTGFGMMVAEWAADGKISGSGPLDDNAKGIMRADNWQPYSVRIGDKWYSYQRLDPIASTMAVAADLALRREYMTDKQADEAAMLVTASIMKNLADKTWLSGVSDFMKAMDDTERYGGALVKRLAGSVAVPTFVAQTARTIDPVARKTNGTVDAIKARIPGLSQTLLPMRDTWGKPITNEGGVGPDFVSPIWMKTAKNDPINAEMLAIGARFGPLPRKVGGRDLSDAEYDQYQSLAGSMMEAEMRKAMMQPGWARMSVDDRADEAEKIKADVRKSARDLLFGPTQRKQSYHPAADLSALPPPPAGFVMDGH